MAPVYRYFWCVFAATALWAAFEETTPRLLVPLAIGFSIIISPIHAAIGAIGFWGGWRYSRHTYPFWFLAAGACTSVVGYMVMTRWSVFAALGILGVVSFLFGLKGAVMDYFRSGNDI